MRKLFEYSLRVLWLNNTSEHILLGVIYWMPHTFLSRSLNFGIIRKLCAIWDFFYGFISAPNLKYKQINAIIIWIRIAAQCVTIFFCFFLQQAKAASSYQFEWCKWNFVGIGIAETSTASDCSSNLWKGNNCIRTRSRWSKRRHHGRWRCWRKADMELARGQVCCARSIGVDRTILCSMLHGATLLWWRQQFFVEFNTTFALRAWTATSLNWTDARL